MEKNTRKCTKMSVQDHSYLKYEKERDVLEE